MPANPIVLALAQRCRRGGAEPLLTWYSPATGGRTELSVRTVANWVDKTANLLDDLGVDEAVAGPVSVAHPGHWMSLVWPLAAWQRGCGYVAGEPDATSGLVVVGPQAPRPHPGLVTIACSLHPLGLGLRGLPDGVLDYTGEALAQPDAHLAVPVAADAAAWRDAERVVTHADLDPTSGSDTLADRVRPGRVLVVPATPWQALVDAVLGPLLGGGSAVVVDGPATPEERDRIAAAERATARVA